MKIFNTKDFAYHKVSVVFWQTDENDKPAYITEPYTKAFSNANIKKEQEFYQSDIDFRIRLKFDAQELSFPQKRESRNNWMPDQVWHDMKGVEQEVVFTISPKDDFSKVFEKKVKEAFAEEIKALTKDLKNDGDKNKAIKSFISSMEVNAEYTHRHYVSDNEYIQHGEDIEEFLKREIGKQIIRWQDSPQLGYEILPNKYFYKYQPPEPADKILQEFWKLEKEAESMLRGLVKDN